MVKNISALLYVQQEHRFSVAENHTNMVKFMSPVDLTYLTVVHHMKESMDKYIQLRCKWGCSLRLQSGGVDEDVFVGPKWIT